MKIFPKKTLYFLSIIAICLSSCGNYKGIKKPVALIDAPADLVIKNHDTGEVVKIDTGIVGYTSKTIIGSNVTTITNFVGRRIKFKPKKSITLDLTSHNVTKTVKIGRKIEFALLIFEGVFTLGTFTAIDLLTGGYKTHNPPYIDVKAVFEDREQRSYKEIMRYMKSYSH